MSMLQNFYNFLAEYFHEGGQITEPEALKARLEQEGFDDVTAYDVREAVTLMYDEGDVFSNQQSSSLQAYTGGNTVDQSFNASNFANVTAGGVGAGAGGDASGGSAGYTGGSGGGGTPPVAQPQKAYTAPEPPPMDPAEGYSDLDAAVEQIVYVTNITNNTTNNTTNIDDRDTFEDNDTIVDSSVNQTILAAGDVTQDFDTITQGDNSIANTGTVADSNFVAGDNDGVIADEITDSNLIDGDNLGVVADEFEGSAVIGDNNDTTTLVDSDNNAVGDGAVSIDGDGNAFGNGATANTIDVDGDNEGVISTGDGGVDAIIDSEVGAANFGDGGGDVNGITDSTVGAAAFGDGDSTGVVVQDSTLSETAFQTGDGNNANITSNDTADHSVDNSIDNSVDNSVDIVETNTVDITESTVTAGDDIIDTDTHVAAVVDDDAEALRDLA